MKSTVIDLVRENNELREENYQEKRDNSLRQLTFLVISLLVNGFLIWLAFFHFPKTKYVWTSNAAAVCAVTPISEPHLMPGVVADFAAQAAVSIYTYDYINYRRVVTAVSEKYFTPEFRDLYMPMFSESKLLQSVIDNTNIVSAQTAGPAQIAEKGRLHNGAFYWKVQVPLYVYYTVGKKPPRVDKILATVTVSRVDPSRMNPSGIAVSNVATAPLLM